MFLQVLLIGMLTVEADGIGGSLSVTDRSPLEHQVVLTLHPAEAKDADAIALLRLVTIQTILAQKVLLVRVLPLDIIEHNLQGKSTVHLDQGHSNNNNKNSNAYIEVFSAKILHVKGKRRIFHRPAAFRF